MRVCKRYEFDHGIKGFTLGWSLAGPPLMAVFFYVFDRVMIDTGQSRMAGESLAIARRHRVDRVFLTHHHEDHSGNGALIHNALGAEIFGHGLTREKLKKPYKILPYQHYVWGTTTPVEVSPLPEFLETSLGRMIPIHTPGHSLDHLVYYLPEKGVVFSGDLYLGDRIRYFRADEDMGTQIDSLKKVLALDFHMLLCSHNPRESRGREHLQTKLNFLETLYGSTIELWKKGVPEKEIFKTLGLKEDYFIKYFCCGNVSLINGVRSAVRHYEACRKQN
ncbi:hypothetical protein HRM2_26190 [Desulforapulum autotrophicum HRM2]|uniref:Metallo-beta-lactamase domain-containing protein n=1 Tax=Desulforapulum autotrophicum (strain ATCC 43914 / DSM 3382 / VKM B-1955 / HRM2) TaxID=177437 RepID=C0QH64_DESAH|nr:MBL fold metallo-hydrolase [Desulforapulum autotrophicum]ACN15713.1 hypothetical protein HRM2_26190 [Desulforapulum autotrophicum HRM2]